MSLFTLCLSVLTEEFRGSVSEGLPETVYKRRRAGWRRETGKKRVALRIFMDEVITLLAFPVSHRRLLVLLLFFSHSDVQQMQSQAEMYQKVQHSEVPSDPRASYPFLESWQFLCVCARHRDVHVFLLLTCKKNKGCDASEAAWRRAFQLTGKSMYALLDLIIVKEVRLSCSRLSATLFCGLHLRNLGAFKLFF